MRKTVYIETTIPSFYFNERSDTESLYRKQRTIQWWDGERQHYSLVTSSHVFVELERGQHPRKEEKIAFLKEINILEPFDLIEHIVAIYVQERLMPSSDIGDAVHLAYASYHKCDYLLTWNCAHLANANKTTHLKVINRKLDLFVPEIVTPDNLFQEEEP